MMLGAARELRKHDDGSPLACCVNCVYWHNDAIKIGECRRNPPIVVGGWDPDGVEVVTETHFPEVGPRDFCGEFKIAAEAGR